MRKAIITLLVCSATLAHAKIPQHKFANCQLKKDDECRKLVPVDKAQVLFRLTYAAVLLNANQPTNSVEIANPQTEITQVDPRLENNVGISISIDSGTGKAVKHTVLLWKWNDLNFCIGWARAINAHLEYPLSDNELWKIVYTVVDNYRHDYLDSWQRATQ